MTAAGITLSRAPSRLPLLAWLLSGVLLLTFLGAPPVTRTQEARVLETARQMLPRSLPEWIVPRLNNALRLQKPPLTYWLTAGAYSIGGVSEGVGRVPDALCGWATLAIVYLIGRRLFDEESGSLGAGLLLGSFLFFRFTRLDETDGPSSLMVTLAIYALLRAIDSANTYLYLAAVGIAGAGMAKGGPAAYPLVFIVLYGLIERDWRLARRFVTSGAILLAVALAGPWFVYVIATKGMHVFSTEVDNLTAGKNHFAWPTIYLSDGLKAAAPWTGVVLVGLFDAVRRWKLDRSSRLVLIWAIAIALPLCVIGNKQPHYLLPLMPPLMLLGGRVIVRAKHAVELRKALDIVLWLTVAAGVGGAFGIWIYAKQQRGAPIAIDKIAAACVMVVVLLIAATRLRRDLWAAYRMGMITVAIAMPLLVGKWLGGVVQFTPRVSAAELRRDFRDGPYLFFGPNVSLPLCFNLRQEIDSLQTTDELLKASRPGTIVIAITKPLGTPPPLPPRFVLAKTLRGPEQTINCFRDTGQP